MLKPFAVYFLIVTFFINFVFIQPVQAQYSPTDYINPTTEITPDCNYSTNTPTMQIGWRDTSFTTRYYEIWRSDGTPYSSADGLTASYFPNKKLEGPPLLQRTDRTVDFNWGASSPDPAVSASGDDFSALWTGLVQAPTTETFTFYIQGNDGYKMYFDGNQVIDKLGHGDSLIETSFTADLQAGSKHAISLQFVDDSGNAEIHLLWSSPTISKRIIPQSNLYPKTVNYNVIYPPTKTPKTVGDGLMGFYFANKDLASAPVIKKVDPRVDFNWGASSPDPNVSSDGDSFSVLWSGQILIPTTGDYTFYVNHNDGATLYVDGTPIIDHWNTRSNAQEFSNGTPLKLAGGTKHYIILKYFEKDGNAEVHLSWSGPGISKQIIPQSNLFSSPINETALAQQVNTPNGLYGLYFNNKSLAGSPILTQTDPTVDFNWGSSSPDPLVSTDGDNFSVRWTGQVLAPTSEDYTFYVKVNDGARLYIDGKNILDKWGSRSSTSEFASSSVKFAAGSKHNITLEYFEKGSNAEVHLSWSTPTRSKAIVPSSNLFSHQFSYTDNSSLVSNKAYSYTVVSYRSSGVSSSGWTLYNYTKYCGVITPGLLSQPCVGSTPTINVPWSATSPATSYKVYRAKYVPNNPFNPNPGGTLTTGLISYWSMNDTGQNVTDILGINNGTAVGSTLVNGKQINARLLGGTTSNPQYLDLGNDPSLNKTSNFTIAGWINPTSTDSNPHDIFGRIKDSSNKQYSLLVNNKQLSFEYWKSNNKYTLSGGTIQNKWQFAAVTIDSSLNVSLYLDGKKVATGNAGQATLQLTTPTRMGQAGEISDSFFHGLVDEFGFWDRNLTDPEILSLYNNGDGNFYNTTSPAIVEATFNASSSPYSDTTAQRGNQYIYQISGVDSLGNISAPSAWSRPILFNANCQTTISFTGTIDTCYSPTTWTGQPPQPIKVTTSPNVTGITYTLTNLTRGGSANFVAQSAGTNAWQYNFSSPPPILTTGDDFKLSAFAYDNQSPPQPSTPLALGSFSYLNSCSAPWFQTKNGDVHTNGKLDAGGG